MKKKRRNQVRIDVRFKDAKEWYAWGRAETIEAAEEKITIIKLASRKATKPLLTRIAKYRKCLDGVYRWVVIIDEKGKYVSIDEAEATVE